MPGRSRFVVAQVLLAGFLQASLLSLVWADQDQGVQEVGKASQDTTKALGEDQALLDDILKKMDLVYRQLQSCQAEFDQESETKAVQRRKTSSGKMYFQKPGKMRWSYLVPEKREVYLQEDSIFIFLPGRNLVIRQTGDQSFPGMAPARLFLGPGELAQSFSISLGPVGPLDTDTHCLRLVPKKSGGIAVEEIFLWIGKEDFLPAQSESVDMLGNRTKLTFRNWETNVAMQQDLFRFEMPPDAEVMDTPF